MKTHCENTIAPCYDFQVMHFYKNKKCFTTHTASFGDFIRMISQVLFICSVVLHSLNAYWALLCGNLARGFRVAFIACWTSTNSTILVFYSFIFKRYITFCYSQSQLFTFLLDLPNYSGLYLLPLHYTRFCNFFELHVSYPKCNLGWFKQVHFGSLVVNLVLW